MKPTLLLLSTLIITVFSANSQNLHSHANAASISNEANATTGWTGPADITSITANPHDGLYSIRIATTNAGRDARYTFEAVIGTVYNISIWARRGQGGNNPAFTQWTGFADFVTTAINNQTWTEYTWSLTATATNPEIRVFAAQSGPAGREIFIDAISIFIQEIDTQPPTAPTNLTAGNTTSNSTILNWTASTDNVGVTEYQIHRNNQVIGTVAGNVTTYNDNGLTSLTTYSYYVTALDAENNVSDPSNTIQVTTLQESDTQPPSAPTNLTETNTTTNSTTLNWTASTDNVGVTEYQIHRNNQVIGTVAGDVTTYNDDGLTASTTYSYYVTALDAENNVSDPSNTIQVTTLQESDTQPPTAPGNLTASNTTSNSTTLNWTASTDNVGVTEYQIHRDNVVIGTVAGNITTYNNDGLTASTTYSYYVTALDAENNISDPSNTIQVITTPAGDTQPPTAPTNLNAGNTTSTSTTLNWTASTDNVGVTEYQIHRDNVVIGTVAGNITTYNDDGLTASTTYSYYVTALDAENNISDPSNTIQVTTLQASDTQPPTAPTNLIADNTTSTSTSLNWTASTDNVGVTEYQVHRNNVIIETVAGNVTTYIDGGLTASTTYNYFVTALDAENNISDPSNTIQVTTSGSGSGEPYTTLNANLPTVNWQALNLYAADVVGIGTSPNTNFSLSVNGNIRTKELIVESGWSDFVFEPDYKLPSLLEVQKHIDEFGHLKDIPSAKTVKEHGFGLSEMSTLMLQKIEELTLYLIELNHRLETIESVNSVSDKTQDVRY